MKNFLNIIPKKITNDKRNIYLFRREDDNLIIQATHVIYILKNTEREIYEKIDGKTRIKELVHFLSIKYNTDNKKISEDVIFFLKQLEANKLIKLK